MDKNIYSLQPMLLERREEPFDHPDWIFEYKWDGFRALIFVDQEMKIISRNQKNLTPYFPELECIKSLFSKGTVLDGEIIAYSGQKGCFSEILRRTRAATKGVPVKFILFDILAVNYKSIIKEPLENRKLLLPQLREQYIYTASYIENNGIDAFEVAKQNNFEGIVAKKKKSLYLPGKRTPEWIKIKNLLIEEFLVVGLRMLGQMPHTLIITDHESSFSQEILLPGSMSKKQDWLNLFKNLVTETKADVVILKPVLGVKISFLEKTFDGKLRHAKICDFFPLKR